jgi:hypothetical protein
MPRPDARAQPWRIRGAGEYDVGMDDVLYLDISCFKRSFDDATHQRVRREAEAVAAILDAAQRGHVHLVRSPAHDAENARNPREDRRLATRLWLAAAALRVSSSKATADRARELVALGFSALDALHLAFAEQGEAQWFANTDDRLLRRAHAHRERLRVHVLGPAEIPLPSQGEHE